MLRTAVAVAALLVLGIAACLCLWPIPAEPVAWPAQKPPTADRLFIHSLHAHGIGGLPR